MDVNGILSAVKGLFDKLEKENVIKLPDNFDNLWEEIETNESDTDTVTITGSGTKDAAGASEVDEVVDLLTKAEEKVEENADENKKEESEKHTLSKNTGVKTGASFDKVTEEEITAKDIAWYGKGGTLPTQKRNLLTACEWYPEIYQPFVEAGLVGVNEYGDYEIADQEAVDRLYGDDNVLSMSEMKELLNGKNFDTQKLIEYAQSQPEKLTDETFVQNFPKEGMSVEEFVQSYKEYPDILEVFEKTDMINVGRWNDLTEGSGFDFLTRNSDGKITKEILEGLLTDGKFDADKIIQKSGRSNYVCYKNIDKTKSEIAEKYKANYEAAQKYMDYFNSLSYEEQKALKEEGNGNTYSFVTYFLEQYDKIMNDPFGGSQSFTNLVNNLQFYVSGNCDRVVKKVQSSNPELLN